MKNKGSLFTILIISAILVSVVGCNFPGANTEQNSLGADQTAVAQTVVVLQTQLAAQPTPAVPTLAQPTVEVIPTNTPVPTVALPTAVPTATATLQPAYKIGPVVDVTYVDNTVVEPGRAIKKTWRLSNTGTGTWNPNFKLVFISGDGMGGPASKPIGQSVAPGHTVEVTVDLTAPMTPKTYQGFWMLQTDGGVNFGIGPAGNSAFWIKIVVEKLFAVTAASAAGPATPGGVIPCNVPLTASITTTGAGKVTYYYITNLGNSPTFEIVFDAAGTKTTPAYVQVVGVAGPLTVQVYIDLPNHQPFTPILTIPIACVP
jgi:hypothetical protein